MTTTEHHLRETIGQAFDQLGTLAIKGEIASETKSLPELREIITKIEERLGRLKQLLK